MFINETCKYIGFPYDKILLTETDRATQRVALTYFRLSVIPYTTYILYSGHAVTMENFPHFTHAREMERTRTSYGR